MSRTIPTEIHGFTPVIDDLVSIYGPMTALVFGKVWRYCQMETGVCFAKQKRMAKELKISRATMNTHIAILVRDGFLEDTTPDLIGQPHTYRDTGKASISGKMTGGVNLIDRGCQAD